LTHFKPITNSIIHRWNFSRSVYPTTWQEAIPELVYGAALFIIALLGVVSHFRFRKLIYQTRDSTNGKSITNKIAYFQDLNALLTVCLLLDGACFIILSADGLTSKFYISFLLKRIDRLNSPVFAL
jgi:hypothetical protein